ncbi:hypothetical protein IEQ34_020344 [Dendrobium chrysotoxum]|uniref:Uncharacterized protein n=1 Tax=Dendrobium chrysotoxum TaxID=161865 RepID=A0AAV7G0F8_DENCH|nr:hypothetical protein IEQ34_020344 [Dendrobium chrysotoxum]
MAHKIVVGQINGQLGVLGSSKQKFGGTKASGDDIEIGPLDNSKKSEGFLDKEDKDGQCNIDNVDSIEEQALLDVGENDVGEKVGDDKNHIKSGSLVNQGMEENNLNEKCRIVKKMTKMVVLSIKLVRISVKVDPILLL